MAARSTIRSWLLSYLATPSDDPSYTPTICNDLLEQARLSLVSMIHLEAPGYLSTVVTLTGSANSYALAAQAADFAKALEVRLLTATGTELTELRIEALNRAKGNFYALTGEDTAVVLSTASTVAAASDLYLRYAYWPVTWTDDASAPAGVPSGFHDLVALEAAAIAFDLGGEAKIPEDLATRWKERRLALIAHVQRRSVKPTAASSVLDRAGIRSVLRGLLGLAETDQKISDEQCNLAILQAEQSLTADIGRMRPDLLVATATLTVDTGQDHKYSLATQAVPITTFAAWLEVRLTDADGTLLDPYRREELTEATVGFAITAIDSAVVVETTSDVESGIDLFLRYRYWPTLMAADSDVPAAIPAMFRDLVALEAVPLVTGGVQPHADRWKDRRAQLLMHLGNRGIQPTQTRVLQPLFDD